MAKPSPLRVAVVARAVMPLHGVGGLERSVHDLVSQLASKDVDVTLITPPPSDVRGQSTDPPPAPHVHVRHVRYVTFPFANRRGTTVLDRSTAYPLFGWRAGRLAGALVREGHIDLVHGFGASVLGYAPGRAPLVFNPQGLEEFGATAGMLPLGKRVGYWPLRRAVRACSRRADVIIATDTALERSVASHLKPRPGQMRTIPNGIDLVDVARAAGPADGRRLRERLGLESGDPVLLSVGRLESNKGLDVLADALSRVAQPCGVLARTGWRWVIVGSGPFKAELERAVAAHGLGSRVLFTGRIGDEELHGWYEAATLFVHPTRYEGSSLVTLEAMAHRKAVVATVAGGLPDKVRPGLNGWLVEPGDPAALAAAIEEALSDPGRLLEFGAHSRHIVESAFAWSVLVEKYLELYAQLLSNKR